MDIPIRLRMKDNLAEQFCRLPLFVVVLTWLTILHRLNWSINVTQLIHLTAYPRQPHCQRWLLGPFFPLLIALYIYKHFFQSINSRVDHFWRFIDGQSHLWIHDHNRYSRSDIGLPVTTVRYPLLHCYQNVADPAIQNGWYGCNDIASNAATKVENTRH